MSDESFKERLVAHCITLIKQKVILLEEEIEKLAMDAANETKSSMGDKYETGRERMMQEMNKLKDQQDIQQTHLNTLDALIPATRSKKNAGHGSLIHTNQSVYLIVAPLGMVAFEGQKIAVVSLKSPIGQALDGAKEGEVVSFNKQSILIKGIL